MTGQSFQQTLLTAVTTLLGPLVAAVENPVRRATLLRAIGYDLAAVSGYDEATLVAWLGDVRTAVEAIEKLVEDGGPQSLDDLGPALEILRAAIDVATSAPPALVGKLPPELPAAQLGTDLLAYLTTDALMRHAPALFHTLVLVGAITPAADADVSDPVPATGAPIRLPQRRPELHLEVLLDLLGDPLDTLAASYFPDGWAFGDAADRAARQLLGRVGDLLEDIGLSATFGLDPTKGPDLGRAGLALSGHMLSISGSARDGGATASFGADLALSSADRGGLGLVLVPHGELAFAAPLGRWLLDADLSAAGAAFAVGPNGVVTATGSATAKLGLTAARLPDVSGLAFLVGSVTGTRLEIGSLVVSGDASFGTGRDDYGLLLTVDQAAFVVAGGDGDSFLGRMLPTGGLRIPFDAGLGWHRRSGWHFTGSASLAATLPLHVPLGPVEVESLYVALTAGSQTGTLATQLAATVKLAMGPVRGEVDRVGLAATLSFPSGGGNVGPADLDVAFQPPSGIGLVIDAGQVTGGGYLFCDAGKGQYAGAVQLSFEGLGLTALGLLTTKNADGTPMRAADGGPGWSLLLIISAEFPPIQLGMGFTLDGVGGLVGINRTAAIDALRNGVRSKALDAVMFPPDPVHNASQVVATLGSLFPAAPGRYIFGPMARLGWGTPTIIRLDLGLVLELPAPVRLIILGRLLVTLPTPETPVVKIHLDAVGVIDFDKREASVDATIYDSTIAGFALTGDMAMRARWGANPGFALSAGGFNPRFTPPPGFPTLRRLAISLAHGDNPRLRLEAYLAVTSNTVQFGARLEVYAEAAGFSISGMLHFDALVQMSPFRVIVDVGGSVALKSGSTTLMAISLEMTLAGPSPWHATGTASVSILFFSISVSFDLTIGSGSPPPPPPAIDLGERLYAALAEPGNWSAQLPPAGADVVTLRHLVAPPAHLLAHPLGTLQVRQREVPLGVTLSRAGSAPIQGAHRFDITQVTYGASGRPTASPLTDLFAPAQFLDLSDDQKLSQPSFVPFQAGLVFGDPGVVHDEDSPFVTLGYETLIVDDPDRPARPFPSGAGKPEPQAVAGDTVVACAQRSVSATAGVRAAGLARFRGPRIPLKVAGMSSVGDLVEVRS